MDERGRRDKEKKGEGQGVERRRKTCLESLVLQDFLDGDVAHRVGVLEELGLEDDAEGAIADNLAICVDEIAGITRLAVGGDDLDDLARIVDG